MPIMILTEEISDATPHVRRCILKNCEIAILPSPLITQAAITPCCNVSFWANVHNSVPVTTKAKCTSYSTQRPSPAFYTVAEPGTAVPSIALQGGSNEAHSCRIAALHSKDVQELCCRRLQRSRILGDLYGCTLPCTG